MSLARALRFYGGTAIMLLISTPSAARAQWYFQAYLGGNHTQRADIHIVQPSTGVDVTYGQVSFEAR